MTEGGGGGNEENGPSPRPSSSGPRGLAAFAGRAPMDDGRSEGRREVLKSKEFRVNRAYHLTAHASTSFHNTLHPFLDISFLG